MLYIELRTTSKFGSGKKNFAGRRHRSIFWCAKISENLILRLIRKT